MTKNRKLTSDAIKVVCIIALLKLTDKNFCPKKLTEIIAKSCTLVEAKIGIVIKGPLPMSPRLGVRADVQFVCPAIALLVMQVPIGLGNAAGTHQGVWRQAVGVFACLSQSVPHEFGVDARINDKMCHMDVFWPKLPGH